jgi:hypothetical protein
MDKLIIYHGSTNIIEKPIFGIGKPYNDYGLGFYCTENIDLAREWACLEGIDGFNNQYELCTNNLNILDLCNQKYSILHWLTILVENRKFRISTPMMKNGIEWLIKNYHLNIESYDIIIGYRADDSYFGFARDFLTNQISLTQLSYAMKLGKLGTQFVLKSKKAFDLVKFIKYETVDSSIYYAKRKAKDEKARGDYHKILEEDDENGIFIRDLIKGKANKDDLSI